MYSDCLIVTDVILLYLNYFDIGFILIEIEIYYIENKYFAKLNDENILIIEHEK